MSRKRAATFEEGPPECGCWPTCAATSTTRQPHCRNVIRHTTSQLARHQPVPQPSHKTTNANEPNLRQALLHCSWDATAAKRKIGRDVSRRALVSLSCSSEDILRSKSSIPSLLSIELCGVRWSILDVWLNVARQGGFDATPPGTHQAHRRADAGKPCLRSPLRVRGTGSRSVDRECSQLGHGVLEPARPFQARVSDEP